MYMIYAPEGQPKQRFLWKPNKMMSAEREAMERRSGLNWGAFNEAVVKDNAFCRRILLHTLLKRLHPTLKFEDVDFAWDEVSMEFSKQELILMREEMAKRTEDADTPEILQTLDEQIKSAIDEEG